MLQAKRRNKSLLVYLYCLEYINTLRPGPSYSARSKWQVTRLPEDKAKVNILQRDEGRNKA